MNNENRFGSFAPLRETILFIESMEIFIDGVHAKAQSSRREKVYAKI